MPNIPTSHQTPLLAALAEVDEFAYLLADEQLAIVYASEQAAAFGVPADCLGQALTSACPDLIHRHNDLESALTQRRRLVIPLQSQNDHPVTLVQISPSLIEGQNRLLVLFRRLSHEASQQINVSQAYFDPHTGLYNRLSMSRRIEEEISRMKRHREKLSLLLLKFPNASQDQLKQIADMLRVHLRVMDIVGNYKDGQFLAILPETSLENAKLAANRLQNALSGWNLGLAAEIQLLFNIAEATEEDNVNALLDRLDVDYPAL
jgi:diguanylate cyclase (GGDEF)-like protein